MRDRTVQFGAACIGLAAVAGAGSLLGGILRESDSAKLRYTDTSIEGAPPIVAVGAAIGALRGLIVDYLWIRLNQMRDDGLFYDAQRLADMITKLQPRFGEVWAFHGHNLAYNLSVLTSTPEERWRLVNSGIDLVRNKGLRYNPNDLILYKDLAFWFAHKIDGVSDDAHLYYKRELAREWHLLLGPPPPDREQRALWLEAMAKSPDTYEELVAKDPGVKTLIDELTAAVATLDKRIDFKLDKDFLRSIGLWAAVRSSPYAVLMKSHERMRQRDPAFLALDDVLSKPANRTALIDLVAFLRKKVLKDDYNMDPAIMARYIREYGPFDFRHPQAHAFYWSKRGAEIGAERYDNQEDIYRIINDDRTTIQAMQALAHSGLMNVDPFSNDNPSRMYDTRWIKEIDKFFRVLYQKHYKTRGSGGDTFVDFHENFMAAAICELYHSGDIAGAQELLDNLDGLYGRGGLIPNQKYNKPLELFVQETTYGEYDMVPDKARTDVLAILRRGIIEGYLFDRKKVLESALQFAADLTRFFKNTRYTDFTTKLGERRMGDLLSDLETSVEQTIINVMRDSSLPLMDRLNIYRKMPEEQQAMAYDASKDLLKAEFELTPLAGGYSFDATFPEPPNMEAYRARQADLARQREADRKLRDEQGAERKQ